MSDEEFFALLKHLRTIYHIDLSGDIVPADDYAPVLEKQIAKIIKWRNEGSYMEVMPILQPVLTENKDIPESFVKRSWNGYTVLYAVMWPYLYSEICDNEFLPTYKLTDRRLFAANPSLMSMDTKKEIDFHLDFIDIYTRKRFLERFPVRIHTQYIDHTECGVIEPETPDFGKKYHSTILLIQQVWRSLYRRLCEPFYVFPLYHEFLFYVKTSILEQHHMSPYDFLDLLKEAPYPDVTIFSNKIFRFDSDGLLCPY